MSAKHTPGPWEPQTIDEDGDERGEIYIVGSNLGGLVGAALPWPTEKDSGDFSRVEANARLIAAAPALLEALKAMVDRWEPEPDGCGDRAMWEAARAAILKAEGK